MQKITILIILIAAVFAVVASGSVVNAAPTSSLTKLHNKINAETAQAATLTVALDSKAGIKRPLKKGSAGNDVKLLQEFLSIHGTYPEGLITGYFGARTEKAVKKFQEKESIDAVGIVGPRTRARILKIGQQRRVEKQVTASTTPEITGVVLAAEVAENGSATASSTSFASTTATIYAALSLNNATQDTEIAYIRSYKNTFIDSGVSHPSRGGLRYLHFQWSLKPGKIRTAGDYLITFYVHGKKSKMIAYTIY